MNTVEMNITGILFAIVLCGLTATGCKERSPTKNNEAASNSEMETTPKPQTGYANVNGLKMYYEVYGEGQPIVMIHGSFMTIPDWGTVIADMAKNRKVIVAEMQGHGRTADIARDFSYEAMADDVSELLKHLKIDSADILGYSMGGGVAFQMNIRHPEQVRKLVVLSGAYKHDGWWQEVLDLYPLMNAEMFKGSPIQKRYDSLAPDPSHFADFVKRCISMDLKPYDWTEGVRNITEPIFMLIGDVDGIRYEHALDLFKMKGGGKMGDMGIMPDSRLAILPGTSHVGMLAQQPKVWIPMVNDFLDAKPQTQSPQFQ